MPQARTALLELHRIAACVCATAIPPHGAHMPSWIPGEGQANCDVIDWPRERGVYFVAFTNTAMHRDARRLERAFIEWAQADSSIEAFCKISENRHEFARMRHVKDNGLPAFLLPRLLGTHRRRGLPRRNQVA